MQTYGGASDLEVGGPGTIYNSGSLIISNNNRSPLRPLPPDSLSYDSGRAYLITTDSSITEYNFDKIEMMASAHLVFDSTLSGPFDVHVGYVDGDLTGVMHFSPKYPMYIADAKSPFPFGFRVPQGTFISFPPGKLLPYTCMIKFRNQCKEHWLLFVVCPLRAMMTLINTYKLEDWVRWVLR